jgi:hypothetical protein
MAAAVHAPHHEPVSGHAEDRSQPLDLSHAETPLPPVTVALRRAHRRGATSAHQLAKLYLSPPDAQAQSADVRADHSGLFPRDFVRDAAPFAHHWLAFLVSTA